MSKQFDYTERPALKKRAFWCRKSLVRTLAFVLTGATLSITSWAANIQGFVFEDLNENGSKDSGEPARTNTVVYIINNALLEAGQGGYYTVTTDGNGFYNSTPHSPARFTLWTDVPEGWRQTAPEKGDGIVFYDMEITNTNQTATVNFGLFNPNPPAVEPPSITTSVDGVINVNVSETVEFKFTFTATGSGPYQYTMDFGDGSTITNSVNTTTEEITFSHVYTQAGTFTATLTLADQAGNKGTSQLTIAVAAPQVNTAPTITLNMSEVTASVGQSVTFNGSFTDPDSSDTHTFKWDFGDGSAVATTQNATHTYTVKGTYTATFTVTDSQGGSNSGNITVTINDATPVKPPVISTTNAGIINVNVNESVQFKFTFTATGSGPYQYTMDFGDGNTTTNSVNSTTEEITFSHVYTQAGTFTATLTLADQAGNKGTSQLTITVAAPPVNTKPTITLNISKITASVGQSVTFNGSFTDPDNGDTHTFKWDFGDGSAVVTTQNATHTYTVKGTYTATFTVTDSQGGSNSGNITVTINGAAPVVGANTGGDSITINVGETVKFNFPFTDADGVMGPFTYVFKFGDGNGSAGKVPITGNIAIQEHPYMQIGTLTAILEVTDKDGNTGSRQVSIVVKGLTTTNPCEVTPTVQSVRPWGKWNSPTTWSTGTVPGKDDWVLIKENNIIVLPTTEINVTGLCIKPNGVLQSEFNVRGQPLKSINLNASTIRNQGTIKGIDGVNGAGPSNSVTGYQHATGSSSLKITAYSIVNETTGQIFSGRGGDDLIYNYFDHHRGSLSWYSEVQGSAVDAISGKGGRIEIYPTIFSNQGLIQGGRGGFASTNSNQNPPWFNGRYRLPTDKIIFSSATGGNGGLVRVFASDLSQSVNEQTGQFKGGQGGNAYWFAKSEGRAGNGGSTKINIGKNLGKTTAGGDGAWSWWEPITLEAGESTRFEGQDHVVIFGGEGALIDLTQLTENAIIAEKTITIAVGPGGTVDLRGVTSKVFKASEKVEIFADNLQLDDGVTLQDLAEAPSITVNPSKIIYVASWSNAEYLVGEPMATLPIALTLINEGPTEDTYTLTISHSGNATLGEIPETITVEGLRYTDLTFEVKLPATRGEEDIITITATSQNDPTMEAVTNVRVSVIQQEAITPRQPGDDQADITLVIDDTDSMGGEILTIADALENLIGGLDPNSSLTVELITFKDQDEIVSRVVTKDIADVIARVRSIQPMGGGDCPNASVAALEKALPYLNNNGQIILATAASPHQDPAQVITQAQQQGVKINVLLAGTCANEASDKALYQNLADQTGGAFNWLPRGETSIEIVEEIVTDVIENAMIINGGFGFILTGQLIDKRGNPITEATIQIDDQTTTTDTDGYWEIIGLIEGQYEIVVSKEHFVFLPTNIELTANSAKKQEITVSVDKEPFDIWVSDPAPDDGTEPGKASYIWYSPDVWVRNQDDGGTIYQNVVFGQDNYVYVNVRNRGTLSAQNTTVEVYRSGSSLGQGWPQGWELVGTSEIASLEPQASEIVHIKWDKDNIPKPRHYCFYIRLLNDDDPMFAPETNNMVQNTRVNNNVAWRNFNVVGLLTQVTDQFEVAVGNPTEAPAMIDLMFDEAENLLQNDGARAIVNLGTTLFQRWQAAGGQGENIQVLEGTQVQLLATPAKLIGLNLNVGENLPITLRVEAFKPAPGAGTSRQYQFTTQAFIEGELIGGVDYAITTRAQDTDSDGDGIKDIVDDDNDNDGISDSWEIQYGLNPLAEADASEDLDGDGQSNVQEFVNGTDPTDSTSVAVLHTVSGLVTDGESNPIIGTTVKISEKTVVTDASGIYTVTDLVAGQYTIEASKTGYTRLEKQVLLEAGVNATVNFTLSADDSVYTVSGIVKDANNQPVAGATVQVTDSTVMTDENGVWRMTGLLNGQYTATISKAGYVINTIDFIVSQNTAKDSHTVSVSKVLLGSLLDIKMTASPHQPLQGEELTYIITITNRSEETATGIAVTDILPDSLTLFSIEALDGGVCDLDTLTCLLPDLVAGATMRVQVIVHTTKAMTLAHKVTVSSNEHPTDVAVKWTTIMPYLSVSLSDNPDPIPLNLVQGETLQYFAEVTLDQRATETAKNVNFVLYLPIGLVLREISNHDCDTSQMPKISCTFAELEVGGHVSIEIGTQLQNLGLLTFTAMAEVIADNYPKHKDRERTNVDIPESVQVDMAIVIDDTGSMQGEIDEAVEALKQFVAHIDPNESPLIAFITFKDEATVRFFGRDLNLLLKEVDNLKASGGGACPEASVEALNAAIPHVKQEGGILFVTDASPYDDADLDKLAELLQSKAIRLNAIITGDCTDQNSWNNLKDSQ